MRWMLAAAAILLSSTLSACGNGSGSDDAAQTPTRSDTPTATATTTLASSAAPAPTPTLTPVLVPGAAELKRGPDVPFPVDMAMIIERGCFGCDGGSGSLVRVYKRPSGTVQTEELFPGLVSLYSGEVAEGFTPTIISHAALRDASLIAAAVCLRGACETGGIYNYDPDSVAAIVLSSDGGITWTEVGRGGPAYMVGGIFADGRVLIIDRPIAGGELVFKIIPDGRDLDPPISDAWPVAANDTVLWIDSVGRLLREDGTPFLIASNDWAGGNMSARAVFGPISEQGSHSLVFGLVPFSPPRPEAFIEQNILSDVTSNGAFGSSTQIWQVAGILSSLGWWSSDRQSAVGSIAPPTQNYFYQTPWPALFDLRTGTYNIITEGLIDPDPNHVGYSALGRTTIHAVQIGPFARVVNTGSCLNVRAGPSFGSELLACVADGVLLKSDQSQDIDGVTWVTVTTPSGRVGWASAEFLER